MQVRELRRVNVVGSSGAGKSTFAEALARKLDAPYVHLDELFWKPNWQQSTDDEFFPKIEHALQGDRWILDGNYTRTIPIKWQRVTCIVWIDTGFLRTAVQSVWRSLCNIYRGTELWAGTGNRETLRLAFFDKNSVIYYAIRNHASVRQKYLRMMRDPAYAHIPFVRLASRRAVRKFLEGVGDGAGSEPEAEGRQLETGAGAS